MIIKFNTFILGYSNPSMSLDNHVEKDIYINDKSYILNKSKSHSQLIPQTMSSGELSKKPTDDIIFHVVSFKIINF